ncbi:hypothetical protein ACH5RR_005285 [Cinchona calisaya]|uniref:Homeobox domain-containing protein n=1 Tax=Cinchona calisaya TaxID=153742 RepID=A0ABD3AKR2_9GENT
MAEGGFEPYHVPQQSRRDKLRVITSQNQPGYAGLVPIYDPALISSDLLACAGLHHHTNNSLSSGCDQTSNHHPSVAAAGGVKEEGPPNFMGYAGGMMINSSSSSTSAATNHHLYHVDPQSSIQLNPSSIQDINGNPFLYTPHQSFRFLDQTAFHGAEVAMVYRPEPLSVAPHESSNHNNNSNNNNSNRCGGQGLSLSLSSHHHSQQTSTTLPLELNLQQRYDSSMYSGKISTTCNELLSRSSVPLGPFTGYASILKGSRFLKPAQQLLEELCDVGRGLYAEKMLVTDSVLLDPPLECFGGTGLIDHDDPQGCSKNEGENENWRKKSRLMSMLDEVYKRYKQYYQQIQAVVASFESVAGVRNAAPFASLALKAMSKHFRCLKNAITDQLQFITESRGHVAHEKDSAKGFENPVVGIHGQRPTQNAGFVEHQPVWRPQRGLPERAVTVLRSWLFEHFLHPYPTDTDKLMLAKQTGLSRNQVSNWFINARVRLWKPMVEEIHMLETRQGQKASQREEQNADRQNDAMTSGNNQIYCEKTSAASQRNREFGSKRTRNDSTEIPAGNEDVINLSYENSSRHPHLGVGVSSAGGSGGVSLTLGLHQNNGLGLPDPFPINAARRFGLDADGEGYIVGGIDAANRQFGREIMGGQLLHDFVG